MTFKEITPLIEAYGFEIKFHKPQEKKMRFQGCGTFLDIWCSKRGTTLGVYNPKSHTVGFKKKLTMLGLENELVKVKETFDSDE